MSLSHSHVSHPSATTVEVTRWGIAIAVVLIVLSTVLMVRSRLENSPHAPDPVPVAESGVWESLRDWR
ncbi:MAG: hypothetical protein IGR92_03060 [Leptolyngbyaceae cyanobacterium T60_A2020_046]|nr:hypothetical protein [Leptolyngbyaceae cyanobacterium T60_A2020_046]